MVFGKASKFIIAGIAVLGLLLISQPQHVFAMSNDDNGITNWIDLEHEFEDQGQSENTYEDNVTKFNDQGFSPQRFLPTSANSLPAIRIMPLGDSITKGFGTCFEPDPLLNCVGYRGDLWEALIAGGYSVDLVGSLGSAYQSQYDHDNDHEGHGGKTADWIRDRVYGPHGQFLLNNPADILLLHIGTNDFSDFPLVDPNDVVAEVSQILDKIDDYENGEGNEVWVILAQIIKRLETTEQKNAIIAFNNALQTMANQRINAGDKLVLVDMESALAYPDDLPDQLHPNETGYSKMAAVWYTAIRQLINFPPTIENPGDQAAIQGQIVSLQIQSSDPENDSLTFSASGLPAGLSINPTSGEISGKISTSIISGTHYQVTIIADDKTGTPHTDPYNKDQVTFEWMIGESLVMPLVIR